MAATNTNLLNLDQIFKKLNKCSTNINDARLKRRATIDKIRYEQGLALETSLQNQHTTSAIEDEIKIENNFGIHDLTQIKIEDVNDQAIENELNSLIFYNKSDLTQNIKIESAADDVEIIEIVNKKIEIEEIVLSDDDDDFESDLHEDEDDDDDVIVLDKDEFAEELRHKLTNLSINKIIKVEEPLGSTVKIKEEKMDNQATFTTTTIMFDSVLGTISGQNDQFISELAQQLAINLNLPFEFMTAEEFSKYKESQSILTKDEITEFSGESEVLLTNNNNEETTEINNNNNGTIKIKGQALIQYLFGNCSDTYKNAITRDSSLCDLKARFQNLQNQRKINAKPVSYYITKKKLRKLELQRKFKKLESHLIEIEKNRNEILTHLYVDYDMDHDNDTNIVIDVALYKNYLYTCTLSGRCNVYNLLNHRIINSTLIDEGAHFIQPLYNDSRFYLSVIIGGQTNLHIYDTILKHKKFSIDLKSQIRCVIFRYHRLYCGLSSGEIISLNRNLNNFDKPIKVTERKISAIGVALYNFEKLLLVGDYDGKIHILQTKGADYEHKNEFLYGHKMPPLSIKCHTEYAYSCSADGHILVHYLRTLNLVSKINFNSPITSLVIQHNNLLSSSADGLIRCHSLNDSINLKICQQYYGYNKNARIMCMKCENNFIYYGDDKGYVESIEFNLQKRHICKFLTCTQPYATKTYLLQHLLNFHFQNSTSINSKVKCEWHNCKQLIDLNNLKFHLLGHL